MKLTSQLVTPTPKWQPRAITITFENEVELTDLLEIFARDTIIPQHLQKEGYIDGYTASKLTSQFSDIWSTLITLKNK